MDFEGIFSADVVLVPLEDGDRCKALVDMGKTVIAIDLNPLSRTAQCARVTVVDNIIRAIPNISGFAKEMKNTNEDELRMLAEGFSNKENIANSIDEIIEHISFYRK